MGEHEGFPGTGTGAGRGPDPDLVAVRADDALLDALGAGRTPSDRAGSSVDDAVLGLLTTWRAEIAATPLPAGPDLAAAALALGRGLAARDPWYRRLRVAAPVAAAAAAVGLLLGGVGYATHAAGPGDPLWGLSQTVFADHSRSVQAAADVEQALARAEVALGAGRAEEAAAELATVAAALPRVGEREGRDALEERSVQARERLDELGAPGAGPVTSTEAPPAPTLGPVPGTGATTTARPPTTRPGPVPSATSSVTPTSPSLSTVEPTAPTEEPTVPEPTPTGSVPEPTPSSPTPDPTTSPTVEDAPSVEDGQGGPADPGAVEPGT